MSRRRAGGGQGKEDARETPPVPRRASPEDEILQLQQAAGNAAVAQLLTGAPRGNRTGLPDGVKAGIEAASGVPLDDVRVHYGSDRPADFGALAMAQGTEIHVAPGQERHVAHEAWHVVQQKQGRVPATGSVNGAPLNDDPSLEREAEEMASGSRPVAAAHPVAEQPAAGPLQRVKMSSSAYLAKVAKEGPSDPEWDPQWTVAIEFVLGKSNAFKEHIAGRDLDDDEAGHLEGLVKNLKELAHLASPPESTCLKLSAEAVREHEGFESSRAPGGIGSVDVKPGEFTGRPGWSAITIDRVPTVAGQARRHIVAWHDIRKFTELAYGKHPQAVLKAIRAKLDARDSDAKHAVDAGVKDLLGAAVRPLTDEETLKVGLYVMNNNPRNLWAGPGKTNSAINTAAMHMSSRLASVTSFRALGEAVDAWRTVSAKPVYKNATEAAADLLHVQGTEQYEAWVKAGAPPATEKDYVAKAVVVVKESVLSNLHIDVFGASKKQTMEAISKQDVMAVAMSRVYGVAQGTIDLRTVEGAPDLVQLAISAFMTYK